MITKFVPDKYQKSVYTINYKKLKREGFKCIVFDLDNTLVPINVIDANKRLKNLINDVKMIGFKVIIMSNSPKSRVMAFQKSLVVDCVPFALKPRKEKYEKILKIYNLKEKEVCSIGDQLFTDVLGANRVGITSILVNAMSSNDHHIKFIYKFLEKAIWRVLSKKDLLIKGKYYD